MHQLVGAHENEDVELLYEETSQSLTKNKTKYNLITSDFNANKEGKYSRFEDKL